MRSNLSHAAVSLSVEGTSDRHEARILESNCTGDNRDLWPQASRGRQFHSPGRAGAARRREERRNKTRISLALGSRTVSVKGGKRKSFAADMSLAAFDPSCGVHAAKIEGPCKDAHADGLGSYPIDLSSVLYGDDVARCAVEVTRTAQDPTEPGLALTGTIVGWERRRHPPAPHSSLETIDPTPEGSLSAALRQLRSVDGPPEGEEVGAGVVGPPPDVDVDEMGRWLGNDSAEETWPNNLSRLRVAPVPLLGVHRKKLPEITTPPATPCSAGGLQPLLEAAEKGDGCGRDDEPWNRSFPGDSAAGGRVGSPGAVEDIEAELRSLAREIRAGKGSGARGGPGSDEAMGRPGSYETPFGVVMSGSAEEAEGREAGRKARMCLSVEQRELASSWGC